MEARANATQLFERDRVDTPSVSKFDRYRLIGTLEVGLERGAIDACLSSVSAPNRGRAAFNNILDRSEADDSCNRARSIYPQPRASDDDRRAPAQFDGLGSRKDCVGIRRAYGNDRINRAAHVAIQAPRLRQAIRSRLESPSGS